MPTPVGPAPRDPNDPDLWDEWYDADADGDEPAQSGFGWPVRLVALLVLVAVGLLLVLAR